MCTNQGFKSLIPKKGVDAKFLYWTMRRNASRIADLGTGATFKEVSKRVLSEFEIDVPTLDIQRHIAAVLDKADTIRRKRAQAVRLANGLLRAIFLDRFGDPITNPKGLTVRTLAEVCTFVSGGTPSKSKAAYWGGTFPWVSPKDMKRTVISDAEDRITEMAFQETTLKRIPTNTVLIVVRGMILAHTVPLAITANEVAINQDLKGIVFSQGLEPAFGLWCLKVQHKHLLSKVDAAAHGTKRLDMLRLRQAPILVPSISQQKHFVDLWNSFLTFQQDSAKQYDDSDKLFASLSQRAFRGELRRSFALGKAGAGEHCDEA
jgi:type I restriction enzyme S subunit